MLLKVKARTERGETYLDIWEIGGKNCRVWQGFKLTRNASYASTSILPKSVRSKSVVSVEEKREKRMKRSTLHACPNERVY